MKKFKGGLYADLSNYNTTLPNTNVLLNFFKSNPIGYRSGGMVRGIAGGNPTGMRVTGGFLANAQKFQAGSPADTVSAYYKRPTAQDLAWLPSGAGSQAAQEGASWRPGNVGQAKQEYKRNLSNTVFNEMMSNPEKYGLGYVSLQQMKESGNVPLNLMSEENVKKLSQALQIPMGDVAEAINLRKGTELFGGRKIEDPIETYGTKETEKIEGGIYQGTQELPFVKDQVFTPLEQQEVGYGAPEGWDLKKDLELLKAGKADKVSEHTKKLIKEGKLPNIQKQIKKEIIPIKEDISDSASLAEAVAAEKREDAEKARIEREKKEAKEIEKQKKYKNLNEYVDSEIEATDSLTKSLDSMQKNGTEVKDSIYPEPPTMEEPLGAEATFNKLLEQGGIADLIQGNKTANAADIKTINEIGKSYYGKKGDKDAPAWALPLMIAGFTMAASDNPDMLGAAAEGGIAGVGAYVAGEKEKKEDAKDQIELQLKKVDAIQKIKGRDLDIVTLQSNMFSTAMQVSSADMKHFREIELAKWTEKNDQINATKDRLFKEHELEVEVDLKLQTLALDRDKFESDDAYKKALVEMEIVKTKIQENQHELEVDLKYRDSGTKEQIIVKDADGNAKPAEVRVYRDLESGKFITEFIGWSPIERETMADWEEHIIKVVENKFADQIEDPKYAEMVENEIQKMIKDKINKYFQTTIQF